MNFIHENFHIKQCLFTVPDPHIREREKEREQTDRQSQTDRGRLTDRQTETETDRQTDRARTEKLCFTSSVV